MKKVHVFAAWVIVTGLGIQLGPVSEPAFGGTVSLSEAFQRQRAARDEYYTAVKEVRKEKGKVTKDDRKRLREQIIQPANAEFHKQVGSHMRGIWDRALAGNTPRSRKEGAKSGKVTRTTSSVSTSSDAKDPRKEKGEVIDGSKLPDKLEYKAAPKKKGPSKYRKR